MTDTQLAATWIINRVVLTDTKVSDKSRIKDGQSLVSGFIKGLYNEGHFDRRIQDNEHVRRAKDAMIRLIHQALPRFGGAHREVVFSHLSFLWVRVNISLKNTARWFCTWKEAREILRRPIDPTPREDVGYQQLLDCQRGQNVEAGYDHFRDTIFFNTLEQKIRHTDADGVPHDRRRLVFATDPPQPRHRGPRHPPRTQDRTARHPPRAQDRTARHTPRAHTQTRSARRRNERRQRHRTRNRPRTDEREAKRPRNVTPTPQAAQNT